MPPLHRAAAGPRGHGLVGRPPAAGRRRAGGRRPGRAHPDHTRPAGLRHHGRRALPLPDRVRGSALPAARLRPAGDPGRRRAVPPRDHPGRPVASGGGGAARDRGDGSPGGAVRGAGAHGGPHHGPSPRLGPHRGRTEPSRGAPALSAHRPAVGPRRVLRRVHLRGGMGPQHQQHRVRDRRGVRRMPVAVLTRHGGAPPAYARDWHTVPAAGMDLHVAPTVRGPGPT